MLIETKQERIPVYPWTSSGRLPFKKHPKCFEEGFEYEWNRVLRLRKERNPIIKGGNYRSLKAFNCKTTHNEQRIVLGYSHCQYCKEKLYSHGPDIGTIYQPRKVMEEKQ